jgi:antitoxin CptB
MTPESHDIRLKRLHMRSMRRGIREMDLILSAFASEHLTAMTADQLDGYESLLDENDQDLYQWVTGRSAAPAHHAALIDAVSRTFQKQT